jgi:predicted nucleic acid-binding protein
MKGFFDTSVLVAVFLSEHIHHSSSIKRFAAAEKKHSACWRSLVSGSLFRHERVASPPADPPEQVLLFVEEIRPRLTLISLTPEEYLTSIYKTAERGFTSGRVYDALLLACAVKWKADVIYTWNVKHFHALAPDLADRIKNP